MFSSCCRCVNKKASLEEASSENESDDSKCEKQPEDNNLLIQKIPLKDPSIANDKENCDNKTENVSNTPDSGILVTSNSVVDTVIKEEDEDEIIAIQECNEAESNNNAMNNSNKSVDGKKSPEKDSDEKHEISETHIVSYASNISDEEKQKILEQCQQQSSTDIDDDDSIIKNEDGIVTDNNHNKEDGITSEENLSTSNENSDQTVKENEVVTVEVNEGDKEQEVNESTSGTEGETSSSKHVIHDDDSFEESSVKSSTYEFPTPPPPLCTVPPNSFEASSFEIPPDLINDMIIDPCKQNVNEDEDDEYPKEYIVTFDEDADKGLHRRNSILSRGGSRSSIKKKVNYNDSTEVIPPPVLDDHPHEEEEECDEVFSDSVPPMLPRGDMCTPFFTKRGSIPGLAALPDWFREEKLLSDRELGGILEPPTTPIGRDEVALRRHRFFRI